MAKRLGHDPLAWMAEEESKVVPEEKSPTEPSQVKISSDAQEIPSQKVVHDPPVEVLKDSRTIPMVASTVNQRTDLAQEQPKKEVLLEPVVPSMIKEWTKITLEQTVTLSQLKELQNQLKDCVDQRVELIGTEVTRIDTAALQLLLAFISNQNTTVSWSSPSAEICKAAKLLGLSTQLSLPNN